MNNQIEQLKEVGHELRANEDEQVTKHYTIQALRTAYNDTNLEYNHVEQTLNKISGDQDSNLNKLDILERELENHMKSKGINPNQQYKPVNQQNILTKCQEMNKKVLQIFFNLKQIITVEEEMDKMIEHLNSNTGGGSTDQNSLQVDTNTILNNFYDSLRQIELVTVRFFLIKNQLSYQEQLDTIDNGLNGH